MSDVSTPKFRIGFPTFFPGLKQFKDTPEARRLAFIKTRFNKRKCRTCGKTGHYKFKRFSWCRKHLPPTLAERLTLNWQMTHYIIPLAKCLERLGRG